MMLGGCAAEVCGLVESYTKGKVKAKADIKFQSAHPPNFVKYNLGQGLWPRANRGKYL